jgi:hypothetical protein
MQCNRLLWHLFLYPSHLLYIHIHHFNDDDDDDEEEEEEEEGKERICLSPFPFYRDRSRIRKFAGALFPDLG